MEYLYTVDMEIVIPKVLIEDGDISSFFIDSAGCTYEFALLLSESSQFSGSGVFKIYFESEEVDDDFLDDIENLLLFISDNELEVGDGSEIKMISYNSIGYTCSSWVYINGYWEFYGSNEPRCEFGSDVYKDFD